MKYQQYQKRNDNRSMSAVHGKFCFLRKVPHFRKKLNTTEKLLACGSFCAWFILYKKMVK